VAENGLLVEYSNVFDCEGAFSTLGLDNETATNKQITRARNRCGIKKVEITRADNGAILSIFLTGKDNKEEANAFFVEAPFTRISFIQAKDDGYVHSLI